LGVLGCTACSADSTPTEPLRPTEVELAWRLEAASEEYVCRWFVVPEGGLDVTRASYELGAGSHHLLVWSTSLAPNQVPQGVPLIRHCDTDAPSHAALTGLLLGAQPGTAAFEFPEGAALRLGAGQVLLVEHHAVNASSEAVDVDARVTLQPSVTPIREEVGLLHYYDWAIHVPPAATAATRMRCVVPEPLRLLSVHGHMHERGRAFRAWSSGSGESAPFYRSDQWDGAPQSLTPSVEIAEREPIEFACEFDNPGPFDFYQGLSAQHSEMCSFTAFYVAHDGARLGQTAEWCGEPGSGVIGQGSLACAEIEACLSGVLAAFSDPIAQGNAAQDCWLAGCPDATLAFMDFAVCRARHCSPACGVLPESAWLVASARESAECADCVAARCTSAIQACIGSACNAAPP
jgi:hypothetical protein